MAAHGSVTRRCLARVEAVLAVAALVIGATACSSSGSDAPTLTSGADPSCPSSMVLAPSGACVGVIHDRNQLTPDLQGLFDRFEESNTRVADSGRPYVKVVLLTPLSARADDQPGGLTAAQVKTSLEGALTGLLAINTTSEFGSADKVGVQVLLAEHGVHQDSVPGLVDNIRAQGDAEHPVVAVVGLGSSYDGTLQTMIDISHQKIPIVSALASAGPFNDAAVPGLRSVSPSNADLVQALEDFIRTQPRLAVGIIVADENPDPFTASLRDEYATLLKPYVKFPQQSFDGGTVADAPPTSFAAPVLNICNVVRPGDPQSLHTVFFAGRLGDFKSFLLALENRVCKAESLVIVAVGSGFARAAEDADLMERGNVSLLYSTSTEVPAWRAGRGTPPGFEPFTDRFTAAGFSLNDLDDGIAINYHDAMVVTGSAIHLTAEGGAVQTAGVKTQLDNLNLANSVQAAGGTLSFAQGQNNGRAIGKLVPLRQIGQNPLAELPTDRCIYVTGGPCAGS